MLDEWKRLYSKSLNVNELEPNSAVVKNLQKTLQKYLQSENTEKTLFAIWSLLDTLFKKDVLTIERNYIESYIDGDTNLKDEEKETKKNERRKESVQQYITFANGWVDLLKKQQGLTKLADSCRKSLSQSKEIEKNFETFKISSSCADP